MTNTVTNLRFKMIEQQIRPWRVTDLDVLHTLEVIKRELLSWKIKNPLRFRISFYRSMALVR
jgi:protein-L-isoaspartate(D-aspartate) O-methyltransferase